MKVLIACEESQAVCIAFRKRGHEAYSCDIQPCSGGHPEWHIQGDAIKEAYSGKYDLMIGHPPCTYLSYVGTRHWNEPGRLEKRLDALTFFAKLWLAPIEKICLENPKGCASPTITKYTQEIQPYYFGDKYTKTTWLWLKNLPPLIHAKTNELFYNKTHTKKPDYLYICQGEKSKGKKIGWVEGIKGTNNGQDGRSKARSKTFPGIAEAMAEQWGKI